MTQHQDRLLNSTYAQSLRLVHCSCRKSQDKLLHIIRYLHSAMPVAVRLHHRHNLAAFPYTFFYLQQIAANCIQINLCIDPVQIPSLNIYLHHFLHLEVSLSDNLPVLQDHLPSWHIPQAFSLPYPPQVRVDTRQALPPA